MAQYRFVTLWHIEAPLDAVCAAIEHSLMWPQWWRCVERVEELTPGDASGIGSVRRYTWKGRLPYRLTFDICVTHIEPLATVEGIASGEVEGHGRWSFSSDGTVTSVRYEWQVRTTPLWMRLLAPFARAVFKWNHDAVMQQGGEGLARRLNARLVGIAHHTDKPP
jgi:hypothetical protein